MKNKVIGLGALCLLLASTSLNAQEQTEKTEKLEEVVVVATKFEAEKEKIGKIIYQITSEDIENMPGKTVADVLDNLAGVQINGNNSAAGNNKSVYVRGGRGYQTLVLIDGVPVSDPSGINSAFDLRLLTLSQVESIEVMNGAASTLYGSGAATGVISIKLKDSEKKPISMNYQTSIGSNNTQDDSKWDVNEVNQNIALSGELNKFNYLANGNISYVNGLSAASDENSDVAFGSDKFQAANAYVRLGYNFSEKFNVDLFSNYDRDVFEYDAGGFQDSDINNGVNTQTRYGLTSNYKYNKGSLKLIASFNESDRMLESFNSWTNEINHSEYTGKSVNVDLVNSYKFNSEFELITGVNYQDFKNQTATPWATIDESLAKYNTVDPYATVVYNSKSGFNINAGARMNIHSEYGNHFVYNVNPSYNFSENFRAIASYSTAFIAPSTYQLFSQYGNPELKPEEDASIEAGFVYTMPKAFVLNTVYFYREVDNMIILPDYVLYQNADETINAKGVEADLNINALKIVNFRLGYTYTYKSSDIDYIPKNKFTALIETSSIKNTYLSLQFKNLSKRTYYDQWGSGEVLEFDAYSLVDLYGSYSIIKNKVSVFAHVSNIFDADYVETLGYTTKGRNYKIGLDFKF
ncbi:MAG: TonB-dependent receptor [Bacteroidetes bacterium]|nr:TonB-dependent receptor [Bacteroidota bacterium]